MTLVEIMISFVVMTIAVFMLSSTITASIAHTDSKRERALAMESAMNVLERMHALPFGKLYALYNLDESDDPEGPGTAPGPFFDVAGLDPWTEDHDQEVAFVGEIVLPGNGPELFENVSIPELGLPRDLNGDLAVRELDIADRYQVLPVTVRITWSSAGGRRVLEIPTMYSSMEKVR